MVRQQEASNLPSQADNVVSYQIGYSQLDCWRFVSELELDSKDFCVTSLQQSLS